MRLAFTVAAHLEPEILLVDEVLAVGDASFQEKCIGQMDDVVLQGRTVLFVSHNLSAVQRLCRSAILLSRGEVRAYGTAPDVTALYLKEAMTEALSWRRPDGPKRDVCFNRIFLCDEEGEPVSCVTTWDSVRVVLEYAVHRRCRGLQVSIGLLDRTGDQVFGSMPQDAGLSAPTDPGYTGPW